MFCRPCLPVHRPLPWALSACLVAALTACGGSGTEAPAEALAAAPLATGITTLELDAQALPEADALVLAQPSFHVAPLLLAEPDDSDAQGSGASAYQGPRTQQIPAELEGLSTRRLTVQAIEANSRSRILAGSDDRATPLAGGSVVATYSPAQIRAAYALPPLPAKGAVLTAAQAAQLGAGQTIYIVNAHHNPNVVAELAAFNTKFGLPGCTTKPISVVAALPLAKPSATACELSVVYNTAAGGMTATAPAYESGWATEIALDVQWAHATAPLARIVLIEAADASLNSLLGGVKLANAMGPGVVSMSFGAVEGNYTAQVDGAFTGNGMSYLAATGDSGASVSWPSVSPKVLAVGGTTLSYSGSGARSEQAWSGTGGGMSAYSARPAYQAANVPGMGSPLRRTVADVAFNANPSTGQYVAVMSPGSAAVSWISAGGTSLSTPQWAGVLAVANALRAQSAKAVLGAPHAMIYGQVAAVPGTYAGAFSDIVAGNHGSCASCAAKAGYDAPTGLGTPQVGKLLSALGSATVIAAPPVVTAAAITGTVGTALSFTVSVNAANAVSFSLAGAPAGMVVGSNGAVSWPAPVAGTYAVTVTARDSVTGLNGQAVYTVSISPAKAPVLAAASVAGKVGTPLSFSLALTAGNAVSYSLSGAPAGMVVASNGVVSWAKPVLGTYKVTVIAKDSKTGLSGQGLATVTISAAGTAASSTGLTITSAAVSGVAGKALSGKIVISAPGAAGVSVSIAGVPMGMMFSVSGLSFTYSWPSPVTGSYTLKVTVADSLGRQATASVPVTVTAK